MAHNSGSTKLFVDNTVPNNPVGISLAEIRRCLYGVSGGEGVDLSRSPNIRKWAKFKPMPVGDMGGYTDAQARAINYGLYVPYFTTFSDMAAAVQTQDYSAAGNYDQSKTPWQHVGLGANDWARVLDFDGYFHTNDAFMGVVSGPSSAVPLRVSPTLTVPQSIYDSLAIQASDIGAVIGGVEYRNLYYGIMVYRGISISEHQVVASPASSLNVSGRGNLTFGSGINYDRSTGSAGVIACVFLTNLTSFNQLTEGVFIPIVPTRGQFTITFQTLNINVYFDQTIPYDFNGNTDAPVTFHVYPQDYNAAGVVGTNMVFSAGQYQQSTFVKTPEFSLTYPFPYNTVTSPQAFFELRFTPRKSTQSVLVEYYLNGSPYLDENQNPVTETILGATGDFLTNTEMYPQIDNGDFVGMVRLNDDFNTYKNFSASFGRTP